MNRKYKAVIIIIAVLLAAVSVFGITQLDGFGPEKGAETSVYTPDSTTINQTSENTTEQTYTDSQPEVITETDTTISGTVTSVSEYTGSVSSATATTSSQTTTNTTTSSSAVTTTESQNNSFNDVVFGVRKNTSNSKTSTVYFTRDISSKGLLKIYKALGKNYTGKVACKLSTGESSLSYYLRPELIKDTVKYVNGTIVECNTAYGGVRSSTSLHKQLAADHGFTSIAEVDILDEHGSMKLPITNGAYLSYNLVGKNFDKYDSYLVLSHFKGHPMGGFGGSIKNISIGLASRQGKCRIHTAGKSDLVMLGTDQDAFLECMADAAKSVCDYLGENITFINVMNNLSVDCDCVAIPSAPQMSDVGILASDDPVALDQACVDIVYLQKDGDGASLVKRIENLNGIHTLERAEENGLGSRNYNLISID